MERIGPRRGPSRLVALALIAYLGSISVASADTLFANSTANNGGAPGWGMFLDLNAVGTDTLQITGLTTASTASANALFTIEVLTRVGTALGGSAGSGPGSSSAGWTSLGSVSATQGATSNEISLLIDTPDFLVTPGQTTGVALIFSDAGPRYFGTGSAPLQTFADANLSLTTGDARNAPFTTGGVFFSSRALSGSINYTVLAIPEPHPLMLSALGVVALWGLRRKSA